MAEIESITIRKVMWRLMPFLFVCYFVAYLDRVNVGFAKLQMNSALGMSEAAYGFGAGLFFLSYFLARSSFEPCPGPLWCAACGSPASCSVGV